MIGIFNEVLSIEANDGLIFDTTTLSATQIRDVQIYGGVRLKTFAYLDKAKIPITIDIGFGDAVTDSEFTIEYPSLLDLPSARILAYPPATVIAEKFQAVVALGLINSRMKDFYDLWVILKSLRIAESDLVEAISATFQRRETEIPSQRPEGLSEAFTADPQKSTQWLTFQAVLTCNTTCRNS
ncbi:MAG: hypothetical protein ACI9HY_000033 [Planctomycetaceae bacterium]